MQAFSIKWHYIYVFQTLNLNLRRTENRNIKALHSIFRGGSSSLPITAANLTFQDFLCRMNKFMQITDAENTSQKISGNTFQSNKKHKLTYAPWANEPSPSAASSVYEKSKTYKEVFKELTSACKKGDEDSKCVMEKLAPCLFKSLRKVKQWDCPSHCLYTLDGTLDLISCEEELLEAVSDDSSEDVFDDLISLHLDKRARAAEPGISCEDDFHEINVFSLAKESAIDDTR